MRASALLKSYLTLLFIFLVIVEESRAILTQSSVQRTGQHPGKVRKATGNTHIYKYLRGYYQNGENVRQPSGHGALIRRHDTPGNTRQQQVSPKQKQGSVYIQPKSGLPSGTYQFAQSPDYVQKLKRLAAILKSRVTGRGQQKRGPRARSLSRFQQQQPQQQQPLARPVPAPRFVPQPSFAPQQSYPLPRPSPPQSGYAQPIQNPSFQSLGLPVGPTYQASQQLPIPITTARPSSNINSQTLIKLLKDSFAALMPLLMNQVKMSSLGVQRIPLYGSNPYRMFGPMTYGPLPKPPSFTPQTSQSSSGYGSVQPQPTLYSSGSQNVVSSGYGGSQTQSYQVSADTTCGPVSELFCHGRNSGLYSHPASGHCFVQCDHMGRGLARSCAPGTFWKTYGPEPALFNYCS